MCARARGISEKGHEGLILQTILYKMKTTGPSYFAVDFVQNLAQGNVRLIPPLGQLRLIIEMNDFCDRFPGCFTFQERDKAP